MNFNHDIHSPKLTPQTKLTLNRESNSNFSDQYESPSRMKEKLKHINFLQRNFLNNQGIKIKSTRLNSIVKEKIQKTFETLKNDDDKSSKDKIFNRTKRSNKSRNFNVSLNNFHSNPGGITSYNKKTLSSEEFTFNKCLQTNDKLYSLNKNLNKKQVNLESTIYSKSIKFGRLSETFENCENRLSPMIDRRISRRDLKSEIQEHMFHTENSKNAKDENLKLTKNFKTRERLNNFFIDDFRMSKMDPTKKSKLHLKLYDTFRRNTRKTIDITGDIKSGIISKKVSTLLNDYSFEKENRNYRRFLDEKIGKDSQKLADNILNINNPEYEELMNNELDVISDKFVNQNNLKRLIKLRNIIKSNKGLFPSFHDIDEYISNKDINYTKTKKETIIKIKYGTPAFIKKKFNVNTVKTFINCDGKFIF